MSANRTFEVWTQRILGGHERKAKIQSSLKATKEPAPGGI